MRKRIAAGLACLLALLALLPRLPARAAESVYFVAVEESVLPLSDGTMPFWSGGYLYVPASAFSGATRDALGITVINNSAKRVTVLDKSRRPLLFYWDKKYGEDNDGNTYVPGAVLRGGTAFLPAAVVSSFFAVQYSVAEVEHGYLVWLRNPDFGMSMKDFANAATYNMEDRYGAYLRAKQPDPPPSEETAPPSGETETIEEPAPAGTRINLCVEAADNAEAILDMIEYSDAWITFYCPCEFLEEQGDLLRRMLAEGHAVGVLVDGTAADAAAQLTRGTEALFEAACVKTRLARLQGADEATRRSAEKLGWRVFGADIDNGGRTLSGNANADALMSRVQGRRGDLSVWLGTGASAAGVRSFITKAKAAGYYCRALREVD